ncbi:DUF2247 family protein [Pseudoalteromonas luteoviolacea]|uniref:DUF2247 domain-containing protein n=1 Tax=Pseudoalteromonas luteoviolacea (strain 2ta16) TaxID=1353533 RepID=V4HS47_PSEL2|nr:DUF2247 family protein [Pseudoalteromonas luteoviolacea]ESP93655.1 hypothetical protein PL2TA16_03041 [Pseudoalteromonas luteoviolacea 2ta16]KZN42444.1 hypothetical protein N483_13060 [Pseudoalteromonas luteoviolacea NCIMB 1944]
MSHQRKIPLSFILKRRKLLWIEVELGISEGWITYDDAIELAIRRVQSGSENNDELELAGLFSEEYSEIKDVLKKLVKSESQVPFDEVKLVWLRIILSWLYENLNQFEAPLDIVEGLYEDFGYPDEIRHLIKYNNSNDIRERSDLMSMTFEEKLIVLWKEYLQDMIPLIES